MAKALNQQRSPQVGDYETIGLLRVPSLLRMQEKARQTLQRTFKPLTQSELWRHALNADQPQKPR